MLFRSAKAQESNRQAKASEDLMSDIKSQLSGDFFDDGASSIENSLRMRDMEQESAAEETPEPVQATEKDERKKAKEALDRAREHVQRLKNRHDKN